MTNNNPHRTCGTENVHNRLMVSDQSYVASRARSENFALEYARTRGLTGRRGITVIPVVVHVIYNDPIQNISDAQIKSQILVLNNDYRKANVDVSNLPAVFAALATDARIEFQLALKDPSGNPTNGITRTKTATASFVDDDRVKSAATGGHDAWPRDNYLNIWVCPLGGGLLGYAQFPGGPAATDGVVISYSAFGTIETATVPFNLGRTATHEIGHFLNLRHIWGDERPGENPCSKSDFVGDTPNQAGPNYDTPAFPHVTCSNGPNGDLFMNYMDYVNDVAMFMFTAGQVTRMHACLDGDRASLGSPKISKLKFIDDPSLKFRDDPTQSLKFRDDITLKFIEDPKLKIIDDPIGTIAGGDPIGPPPFGGGGNPLPFGARGGSTPFILSTPHHSMSWANSFPQAYEAQIAAYEQQLAQLEQIINQYREAERMGVLTDMDRQQAEAVYTEYERLGIDYQRMIQGS
jgi:hypothetical protein